MKELRDNIRYPLDPGYKLQAVAEIDGADKLSGIVSDLSSGGFSFNIDIADSEFSLDKFLFVRINFGSFTINAEVEKRWGLVRNTGNRKVYAAGVSFKVISNEDRLRLNEIIEYLRSESVSGPNI